MKLDLTTLLISFCLFFFFLICALLWCGARDWSSTREKLCSDTGLPLHQLKYLFCVVKDGGFRGKDIKIKDLT